MKRLHLPLSAALLALGAHAQATWLLRASSGPTGRHYHNVAHDTLRGRTIAFGGQSAALVILNDTWEWDGAQWTQANPSGALPAGRCFHGFAYDAARQRTVLFGGIDATMTQLGDTWEWSGTQWTQRFPSASPSSRQGALMCYDSARQRCVLFGGTKSGTYHADTWEWDGTSWTQASPASAPAARANGSMVYDERRARCVLFGGINGNGGLLADTWEWNGTAWAQIATTLAPPPRDFHASCYDAARGRTLIFGGRASTTANRGDTWEYDGAAWKETTPGFGPTSRNGCYMAFDRARARTVLFGGMTGLSDTFEYLCSCQIVGSGMVGGGPVPACTTAPAIGGLLSVSLPSTIGINWLALGAGPCAASPVQLGPPALCGTGYVWMTPLVIVSANGNPGALVLPIPPLAAFVGQQLCMQGLVLQPINCLNLSDALEITIQVP